MKKDTGRDHGFCVSAFHSLEARGNSKFAVAHERMIRRITNVTTYA